MSKIESSFDLKKLKESMDLLKALAHPLRLTILEYIDQNKEINVNKIYNALQLEQSITSQHLRIMRQSGLLDTHRDGKFIYYSINYDKLAEARAAVGAFMSHDKAKPTAKK